MSQKVLSSTDSSDVQKSSKKRALGEDASLVKKKKTIVAKVEGASNEENYPTPNDSDVENPKEVNELALTNFSLSASTIKALKGRGIEALFPIQAQTFHHIFSGKDLVGRARTGTGKTLAFALPLAEKLKSLKQQNSQRGRHPRVIVMAPTRELAKQVAGEFESIAAAEFNVLCVYGGTSISDQCSSLRRGVDVLVGTPGRIKDLIERQALFLDNIEYVCMDEADQMLDIGFADDMEKILALVMEQRKEQHYQTLLFSATLPAWIYNTFQKYLMADFVTIDLIGNEKTKAAITVQHFAIQAGWHVRKDIISDLISIHCGINSGRAIVFTNQKRNCDELANHAKLQGHCQALHGDVSQMQRESILGAFRDGRLRSIACTNVAARGLDIPEVDLVINCEPPQDYESYIHRSGRTGRAGRTGVCYTFVKSNEMFWVRDTEKKAGITIKITGPPTPEQLIQAASTELQGKLEGISEKVWQSFAELSKQSMEALGPERAIAAAFAVMSGYGDATGQNGGGLQRRSLLSGDPGFVTLFAPKPAYAHSNYPSHYFKLLEMLNVPRDSIKLLRLTQDGSGAVFDVQESNLCIPSEPEGKLKICGKFAKDIILCKDLPLLNEREGQQSQQNRGGYGYGGSRSGGSRGGGSRSGGGYGRSSGGSGGARNGSGRKPYSGGGGRR